MKTEYCQTIDEIAHPAVREILRYLHFDCGAEIHHDGDLPARSGMGSSSAFTVGLLHGLYALKGHIVSKQRMEATGFRPSVSLDDGIDELTKGFQVIRRNQFSNV